MNIIIYFFNWFNNLPVELQVFFVSSVLAIFGYLFNSRQNRLAEVRQQKINAYAELLRSIELGIPAKKSDVLLNQDVKKLNEAMSIFVLYAPNKIIKRVNEIISKIPEGKMGRSSIQEIKLVLHNDLYNRFFGISWPNFLIRISTRNLPYYLFNDNE